MRFGFNKPGDQTPNDQTGNNSDDSQNDEATKPLEEADYHRLEAILDYKFKEYSHLRSALTHRSLHIKGDKTDYERLEFLGDAVLGLAVAHLLLKRHPEAKEGELSKMRAALVNTNSLASIAMSLNLNLFIRLSRSELINGAAKRPSILADVFEALMGAVYKEAGFPQALQCIEKLFGDLILNVEPSDPKTELQEALRANGQEPPVYLLECVEGPEHSPTFVSIVKISDNILGRGKGTSKKASQQQAAAQALELITNCNQKNQGK